ncbi:MAG: hypothetical protein L0Z73_15170 [Gammaproteobacteria bacterium]|nr:hypothetical protein [Gammaproteobacteria bacterium]
MSITLFAVISALLNLFALSVIYAILALQRKTGKSDIQQSRVTMAVAGFVVPIVVSILFVVAAIIAQRFFQYPIPVGQHGGGVFIILIASVAAAVFTLMILLPRIKHRWED